MIDLQNIRNIVYQIFSETGYSVNNINIQFPHPFSIKVTKNDESISIDFIDKSPKISVKKFITLSTYIRGVVLNPVGGILKLKYLPDISFSYERTKDIMFGQYYDFSSIEDDINKQFKDDARQKLATQCLQYGVEWATIASQGNENFAQSNPQEQKELKKQCKEFITENIKQEKKFGSPIIAFLFLYVLLPIVLKWIVEKIFRKIFG